MDKINGLLEAFELFPHRSFGVLNALQNVMRKLEMLSSDHKYTVKMCFIDID